MTAEASTAWTASVMAAVMPSTVSLNLPLKLCRGVTKGACGATLKTAADSGRSTWRAGTACPHRPSGTTRRTGSFRARNALRPAIAPTRRCTHKPCATFLALVPGHGHQTATLIMQAINRDATDDALRLVDESHAQLLDDRRTLEAVEAAVGDLSPVPLERGDTFVGPLARR